MRLPLLFFAVAPMSDNQEGQSHDPASGDSGVKCNWRVEVPGSYVRLHDRNCASDSPSDQKGSDYRPKIAPIPEPRRNTDEESPNHAHDMKHRLRHLHSGNYSHLIGCAQTHHT